MIIISKYDFPVFIHRTLKTKKPFKKGIKDCLLKAMITH